ncbi:glycoside hydrolase [Rhizosphaericola mali]|uniref:Beta-glycosidase n=1 Tax=Rhizosphaericola mali TaxID=2545455 RepID=A0A5P2G131_9BACT|nr:glycoside hydrolase [Rhizosphaericola mali]QES89135.1 beta-glycosidase [Rhizosphaericola mali]
MFKTTLSLFLFLGIHITHAQSNSSISIEIDSKISFQRIDNIGASSAWFTEFIGKYWSEEQRENMARWLFSKKMDKDGNPEGIGLSSFRFNIGGGTTELGDSSRIKDFRKRVECFLDSNGHYDWNKQIGYLWFVKKAKAYGVKDLIAFSNTQPVFMTTNGLGFKTIKDYTSNLKTNEYGNYAQFLANILSHFAKEKIHFNYISPVNEPQWDWYNNSQEGSPWTNYEISKIVKALDSALVKNKINSKIITPEAGHLEYLYSKKGRAGEQVQMLFNRNSSLDVSKYSHVLNAAAGHSYYTDGDDSTRIAIRKNVRDTAEKYGTSYWQTEYSMLGDNYKEGKKGKVSAMDCALFLSKVIHDDFVYGNAKAWQFWNSVEPGNPDFDTRYFLLALQSSDSTFVSGKVIPTKMLWALGNYSHFILPNMHRIKAVVNNGLNEVQQAKDLMVSAFEDNKQIVVVLINYSNEEKNIHPNITNLKKYSSMTVYLTNEQHNLSKQSISTNTSELQLQPRSIYTIVIKK